MRIAFHAPLKPPNSPVPSGDRQMARRIMAALRLAGHETELVSVFRTRDGAGDAARQQRIRQVGERLAERLIARLTARPADKRPQLWFTYHLYHKAPDWLGPAVCDALDIPYVLCEASFAPKQEGGPWALGHEAAAAAIRRADAIIGLNSADSACIRPLLREPGRLREIRPFTDVTVFSEAAEALESRRDARSKNTATTPLLLAVGMMREGDKLESYRVLGRALKLITDTPWRLVVVGDGPARGAVKAALDPLGADRVEYAGQLPPEKLPEVYASADLFVWPAEREAYGVAILEAQSTGLPVVAGDVGGVGDIVRHGETGLLVPQGDTHGKSGAFADAVRALLKTPDRLAEYGRAARATAMRDHSMQAASRAIDSALAMACGGRGDNGDNGDKER